MNKNRHQELCKIFDQILTNDPTPQIVANNYLHILNLDPESLKKYNPSNAENIWLSIRSKLVFLVRIFQSIFNTKHDYDHLHGHIKSDVLFVSHLTNEKQFSKSDDAYFGDLPELLLKCNVNSSIALLRHISVNDKKILKGWQSGKIPRFVLNPSLFFLSEIKLYLTQIKSKKQLHSTLKRLPIDAKIAKCILRYHYSLSAIRIAKQVADIAKKTNAKFVITTYEGHAWERLVYYYVRKVNPDIKCFGYQHAAVLEYQHAIKRPLSAEYNPDIIFTSGLVTKYIFEKEGLKGSEIVCLGSPKNLIPNMVINKVQSCLVVPEGMISECLILFKLSLEYARQHKNQKFIWRLHPLLSFEKLKKQSSIYKGLPDNIILSEGCLDDDIQKCSSVLYRGSTAVVNAINAGLKPIYYQQSSDELCIDPIYTHKNGKSIVHNQEELGLALDRDIDAKTMQSLHGFAQDFYTPLDVSALLKLL